MYLETNQIYHGDCRELLKKIQPESIALSFWSPPYHVGKEYEKGVTYEQWQALLKETIALHFPILKPGGFLAINIGDILVFRDESMPRIQAANPSRHKHEITRELVLATKQKHPDYNRDQLANLLGCSEQTIDRRLNGNNIRGGKYNSQTRVKIVGGFIEQFALDAGLFPYDQRIWVKDPAWANSQWHTLSYRAIDEFEHIYVFWKPGITVVDRNRLTRKEWSDWGSRGVWNIPSVRSNDDHEAKFPAELAKRVIKLLSGKGETVLDCFMGSGTTAIAAVRERRNFLGVESLGKYAKLAQEQVEKEIAKLSLDIRPEHHDEHYSNIPTQLHLIKERKGH